MPQTPCDPVHEFSCPFPIDSNPTRSDILHTCVRLKKSKKQNKTPLHGLLLHSFTPGTAISAIAALLCAIIDLYNMLTLLILTFQPPVPPLTPYQLC